MGLIRYEDLEVYQTAFQLALTLHKASLEFPKIEQYGGIADQIRRSSKSICANIAEGLGKQMSVNDKRRFLQMALGSAEETRVWLAFGYKLGYISGEQSEKLREDYHRVCLMLFKFQHGLKF